jgi:5'-nucleotidase
MARLKRERVFRYRAPMKFLLSNDDGIDADGLAALLAAARDFGEAIVVAPAGPQSGMSHAVTWDRGVRLESRGAGRWAVHGTPADCARLGLLRVAANAKWVLSGINHGGNLGADVYYSGTVAAVREAVLHGWPGIAFSQYLRDGVPLEWSRAARWTARVLAELLPRPIEPGLFYNVNLPHPPADSPEPGIVFCSLDPNPLPLSYRHEADDHHLYDGDYQTRLRTPNHDVDICFGGQIAITAIRLF